ncbi:hypothetical protein PVAP13_4NG108438 [Panicum virgatum]|uniref:Uncharacterized protein n=1 Tax=Panicum virgatum TaxID=38727 RepID=A0A8T0T9U5_PANVG|nr:hypothetical protein PVAP13_4NG108438 [Panicum virgatum]
MMISGDKRSLFPQTKSIMLIDVSWTIPNCFPIVHLRRTGLWPSGKLPVVGGSRRGFEPPHLAGIFPVSFQEEPHALMDHNGMTCPSLCTQQTCVYICCISS